MNHIPVLREELLKYADPRPNQNFIDATVGDGGHALAIFERIDPQGKLLGIDLDKKAIEDLTERVKDKSKNRIILVCDNFVNLKKIVEEKKFGEMQGIIADLGLSSMELEERGRGFSFLKDEPLDMRFSETTGLTAEQILNEWTELELEKIFQEYGEERFSRQIARQIVRSRKTKPIKTTFELVKIIKAATPAWYHHRRIHPATKIFQALRIAVNDELKNLTQFLPQAFDVLDTGGRLVIISFHSLEDRIVKRFLKEKKQQNLFEILTKKAIRPSEAEIKNNPRSRSAKLRAVIKI